MYDEGEAQDIGYERKAERMSREQLDRRSLFLDGTPVALHFIGEREPLEGRFSEQEGVFVYPRDYPEIEWEYGLYYVTTIEYTNTPVRLVMLPHDVVLGQVRPREIS